MSRDPASQLEISTGDQIGPLQELSDSCLS